MVGILSAGAGVVVDAVAGSGSDAGQRPALPEETASLRGAQRRGSPWSCYARKFRRSYRLIEAHKQNSVSVLGSIVGQSHA